MKQAPTGLNAQRTVSQHYGFGFILSGLPEHPHDSTGITPMQRDIPKRLLFISAVFASGFVSLAYQIVWTKQLSAVFGIESIAILAVITAYMGGLAAGALLLNQTIQRSKNPLRWLAGLEGVIGAWALASHGLLPYLSRWLLRNSELPAAPSANTLLVFGVALVLFFPATLAMGATLPAMERSWRRLTRSDRGIGLVYGVNTAGAAVGVLTATFKLIPGIGLETSLLLMSASSALTASIVWGLKGSCSPATPVPPPPKHSFSTHDLSVMACLGLLGMTYQIACVRVLSQVLENSVFTYASILAVYLLGTSLGGLVYHRLRRHTLPHTHWPIAIVATALLICLNLQLMAHLSRVYDFLLTGSLFPFQSLRFAEFLVATLILFLPTIEFGYLFASRIGEATPDEVAVGRPVGWNLIGAMLAPSLFYCVIPHIGSRNLLIIVSAAYLCLLRPRSLLKAWPFLSVFVLLGALAPTNHQILGIANPSHAGTRLLEGRTAVVSIVNDAENHKRLEVNQRFMMGGSRAAISERRQAHLPLLVHPNPKNALFLGVGTGITLGAATHYPGLRSEGVELLPEILDNLDEFSDWNHFPYNPNQVQLHLMDARRFIKQTNNQFDVIVADVFHPARDGAGLLYTQEHFAQIQDRLKEDGLFCQWVPIHQFDQVGLSSLVTTFHTAFPHTSYWLLDIHLGFPIVGLIGSRQPIHISNHRFEQINENSHLEVQLKTCRLHTPKHLMTCFLGNSNDSESSHAEAPLNTDDFQFVTYHAPLKASDQNPFELLDGFRSDFSISPGTEAPALMNHSWLDPWVPFLTARNLYMEGTLRESRGDLDSALALYFKSIEASPRFTLSYAQCIRIATQRLAESPSQGTELLKELIRVRPNESLAKRLLSRIQQEPAP